MPSLDWLNFIDIYVINMKSTKGLSIDLSIRLGDITGAEFTYFTSGCHLVSRVYSNFDATSLSALPIQCTMTCCVLTTSQCCWTAVPVVSLSRSIALHTSEYFSLLSHGVLCDQKNFFFLVLIVFRSDISLHNFIKHQQKK